MLRNIFVALIILLGIGASLTNGPFYALLFYLWNAYFRPEQWVYNPWVFSLKLSWIIGIAVVLMTLGKAGTLKPKWTTQTVFMFAFVLQSLFSAVESVSFDYSWFWWTEFLKLMIIGYMISLHVDSANRVRMLIMVIAVSLGFEAAKQGLAQLMLNPGARNTNEHPVLGDNNGVAVGMMMLAPLLPALANTTKRRWEKWGWWVACVGIVYRGISTYSRGGLLAAFAVGMVHLGNSRRRIQALILVVLASGIVLSVMPQQFWDRMNTINVENEDERDSSSASRLHFWRVATTMAIDKPLTGVGFNAFSRAFDSYDTLNGFYGTGRAVHSTWFGMLAEVGIPGLVLLLAILGRSIIALRRTHRMLKGQKGEDAEIMLEMSKALQSTYIAYIIGGSFINAHYSEMFWQFSWLTIAIECIAYEIVARNDAERQRKSPVAPPLRPVPRSRPYAVAR